jgi:hypothetical protein
MKRIEDRVAKEQPEEDSRFKVLLHFNDSYSRKKLADFKKS